MSNSIMLAVRAFKFVKSWKDDNLLMLQKIVVLIQFLVFRLSGQPVHYTDLLPFQKKKFFLFVQVFFWCYKQITVNLIM